MALDGGDRREIVDMVAAVARAERARPPEDRGDVSALTATVVSVEAAGGYANVVLDGDATSIPCQPLVNVAAGARVLVLFVPPSGAYAVGLLDQLAVAAATAVPANDVFFLTTDASGYVTIPHGQTYTPRVIQITPLGPGAGSPIFAQVTDVTATATNLRVRCLSQLGVALNAVTVSGYWSVWP